MRFPQSSCESLHDDNASPRNFSRQVDAARGNGYGEADVELISPHHGSPFQI
jgi:hypothetical protein